MESNLQIDTASSDHNESTAFDIQTNFMRNMSQSALHIDPRENNNIQDFTGLNITETDMYPDILRNHSEAAIMTKTEQIGFTVFFTILLLWGLLSNGLVIGLTAYHSHFHQAYMYIRAVFAVLNILIICEYTPIIVLHLNSFDVPQWVTCLSGSVAAGLWFSSVHLTGILALERYFYFCCPMKYDRYFNLQSIVTVTLLLVVPTQAYMFITEYIFGRDLQIIVFMCQLKGKRHAMYQICVYVIPTIAVVLFCIYKIKDLMNKIDISPPSAHLQRLDSTEAAIRCKNVKRALRLILLVSGTYWGTCIPYFIIRYVIIIQMGFTWEQLNSFENPIVSYIIRLGHIFGMGSIWLDPIIYFSVNQNLRTAFLRLFCRGHKGRFTWEDPVAGRCGDMEMS